MSLSNVRVVVPLDTVLDRFEVFPLGSQFFGFWVESAPVGSGFTLRIGRGGQSMVIPVGAGLIDECDPTTEGLFLDLPVAVPGGVVVIQVSVGGGQRTGGA